MPHSRRASLRRKVKILHPVVSMRVFRNVIRYPFNEVESPVRMKHVPSNVKFQVARYLVDQTHVRSAAKHFCAVAKL